MSKELRELERELSELKMKEELMGSDGSPEKCDREMKHIALDNAIRHLGRVVEQGLALVREIDGSPCGESLDREKEATPSLVQVLTDGPDGITEFCNKLESVFVDIRQRVF